MGRKDSCSCICVSAFRPHLGILIQGLTVVLYKYAIIDKLHGGVKIRNYIYQCKNMQKVLNPIKILKRNFLLILFFKIFHKRLITIIIFVSNNFINNFVIQGFDYKSTPPHSLLCPCIQCNKRHVFSMQMFIVCP